MSKIWEHFGCIVINSAIQLRILKDLNFIPYYAYQSRRAHEETLSGGLHCLKPTWNKFLVPIVQNSFTGSGCYYESEVDYSG